MEANLSSATCGYPYGISARLIKASSDRLRHFKSGHWRSQLRADVTDYVMQIGFGRL
jgi:hypothetical protein